MRKKNKFIVLFLLLPLAGCTMPSQWIADAQVDELCAKDGGIKVYETVTLPKERFNEWGQFKDITIGENTRPTDDYYIVWKTKDILGNSNSGDIGELTVYQNHFWVYRRSNQKLLGESISYSRRGGDPPLPAHPSSYSCPKPKVGLEEQIFLKSNN